MQRRRWYACPFKKGLQQCGNRRLTNPPEAQGGHGYTELAGSEIGFQVGLYAQREPR